MIGNHNRFNRVLSAEFFDKVPVLSDFLIDCLAVVMVVGQRGVDVGQRDVRVTVSDLGTTDIRPSNSSIAWSLTAMRHSAGLGVSGSLVGWPST